MEGWVLLVLAVSGVSVLEAQLAPRNSFFYQCNDTGIGLAVKSDPLGTGALLMSQYLTLGLCHFSAITDQRDYIVFEYLLTDCGIRRQVSGNAVQYYTNLVYNPPSVSGWYSSPFSESISCISRLVVPTLPPVYPVVALQSGSGALQIEANFWNADFTGARDTRAFFLGSSINVEFAVQMALHQPLQLYIDWCTATPTPDLATAAVKYSIILNHGCFVDGKQADSRFLARTSPSRMRFVFQAFRFAAASTNVYLHCRLSVWDPEMLSDPTRKVCSFYRDTGRWELLDDPSSSSVCNCCDSTCPLDLQRSRRDLEGSEAPLAHTVRIGPLRVQKSDPRTGSFEWDKNSSLAIQMPKEEHVIRLPPAVGALLMEVAVVLLLSLGVHLYNKLVKTGTGMAETETSRLVLDAENSNA